MSRASSLMSDGPGLGVRKALAGLLEGGGHGLQLPLQVPHLRNHGIRPIRPSRMPSRIHIEIRIKSGVKGTNEIGTTSAPNGHRTNQRPPLICK